MSFKLKVQLLWHRAKIRLRERRVKILLGLAAVLIVVLILNWPHSELPSTSPEDPPMFRVVLLPESQPLGRVSITQGGQWRDLGEHRGQVLVPYNEQIGLLIGGNQTNDLSYFSRVADADFYLSQLTLRGPTPDAQLAHVANLSYLERLDLMETGTKDAGLAQLANLRSLKTLTLLKTEITDAGLAHLKELKSLKTLLISSEKVTDAGMERLGELKGLESLSLAGPGISDKSVAVLSRLKQLKALNLAQTAITPNGAEEIRKALPRCKVNVGGGQAG